MSHDLLLLRNQLLSVMNKWNLSHFGSMKLFAWERQKNYLTLTSWINQSLLKTQILALFNSKN